MKKISTWEEHFSYTKSWQPGGRLGGACCNLSYLEDCSGDQSEKQTKSKRSSSRVLAGPGSSSQYHSMYI
jgi:hypothetical protein